MILFSWRRKLAVKYEKWLEQNPGVKDCPETVIGFLVMHNLLDGMAVKEYLEGFITVTLNKED